jgi:predicted metal-dependent HD superfamily phosphohydrolase
MHERTSPDRLATLLRSLGVMPTHADMVARRVDDAWREPHRRYHTLQHLGECLAFLDDAAVRDEASNAPVVEVALWFHDLVYDTQRGDNEERSADEAQSLLAGHLSEQHVAQVVQLVLATKDHVTEVPDGTVLLDVDLSILGASSARFAEYEAQIREEYAWVDDEAYRLGRRAVLARFAARPRLFATRVLHERLETRARENLARALAAA